MSDDDWETDADYQNDLTEAELIAHAKILLTEACVFFLQRRRLLHGLRGTP